MKHAHYRLNTFDKHTHTHLEALFSELWFYSFVVLGSICNQHSLILTCSPTRGLSHFVEHRGFLSTRCINESPRRDLPFAHFVNVCRATVVETGSKTMTENGDCTGSERIYSSYKVTHLGK